MSAAWTYLFGTLSDWWSAAGDAAHANATAAEASATASAASAATASVTASAAMFNGATSYAQGQAAISATNFQTYRRNTAGTSATDPASDAANWTLVPLVKTVEGVNIVGTGNAVLPIGMKLLATVTPTVAANIDFLTTFTSDYDNYLIVLEGILPATSNKALNLRMAVAGVADAGPNYSGTATINTQTTTADNTAVLSAATLNTGKGLCGSVLLTNCNDAVNAKGIEISTCAQTIATPGWTSHIHHRMYFAANAVTGFRLYPQGDNFAATGQVRVYGFANT
jgi:hypothetical protein